jgi:hypothetical protein
MSERLPLLANRIAEVARAALVSELTVRRYRRMSGDGVTPRHALRRAQEAAITRAIRELPAEAQLQIPSVAGCQPPKRLAGVSPNMGQPGEVRSCPVGPDDCMSPTPTTPAERSAPILDGIQVVVDPDLPADTMEIRSPGGRVLAKVINIKPPPRPRLSIELPDGTAVVADEQPAHWWEPREGAEGATP